MKMLISIGLLLVLSVGTRAQRVFDTQDRSLAYRARFYEFYVCKKGVGTVSRNRRLRWMERWDTIQMPRDRSSPFPIFITQDQMFCYAESN